MKQSCLLSPSLSQQLYYYEKAKKFLTPSLKRYCYSSLIRLGLTNYDLYQEIWFVVANILKKFSIELKQGKEGEESLCKILNDAIRKFVLSKVKLSSKLPHFVDIDSLKDKEKKEESEKDDNFRTKLKFRELIDTIKPFCLNEREWRIMERILIFGDTIDQVAVKFFRSHGVIYKIYKRNLQLIRKKLCLGGDYLGYKNL